MPRDDQGTGRPDTKMSRWDDGVKRTRFGSGTPQRQRVQAQANAKRRQRDRASVAAGADDDLALGPSCFRTASEDDRCWR